MLWFSLPIFRFPFCSPISSLAFSNLAEKAHFPVDDSYKTYYYCCVGKLDIHFMKGESRSTHLLVCETVTVTKSCDSIFCSCSSICSLGLFTSGVPVGPRTAQWWLRCHALRFPRIQFGVLYRVVNSILSKSAKTSAKIGKTARFLFIYYFVCLLNAYFPTRCCKNKINLAEKS